MSFKYILGCGSAAAAVALALPAAAQERSFNIPAQDLASAISVFGRQSGLQIVAPADQLAGLRSQPVIGRFDARAALRQLIAGAGLETASDNGDIIVLRHAAASFPEGAQAAAEPISVIVEDIIVTAQKREGTLFETAAPLAVMSGDEMLDRGATQLNDLANQLVGVSTVADVGGTESANLSIRGIGGTDDTRTNGSASVAFHIDDVYQSVSVFRNAPMFDVERIEVLRGPQGTLYGRNSTAGVVNVITARPKEQFGGFVRGEIAEFERFTTEGAITGRIVEGVTGRLAAFYDTGGGFRDGLGTGRFTGYTRAPGVIPGLQDPGKRNNFGDADVLALRGTLNFDLGRQNDLTIRGWTVRDKGESFLYDLLPSSSGIANANDPDDNPFTSLNAEYPERDVLLYALSAAYEHDLGGGVTFDFIGGHQWGERELTSASTTPPLRSYSSLYTDDFDQTTIEARLTSDWDGKLNWLAGVFFVQDNVQFDQDMDGSDNAVTTITSEYTQERESYAAFGQIDYDVTNRLTVTAGLRYSADNSVYYGNTTNQNPYELSTFAAFPADQTRFVMGPHGFRIGIFEFDEKFDDENISGRLTVAYRFSEILNAYVSYGTGYKSGGFDGSTILSEAEAAPFRSEDVRAIEGGLRYASSNGRYKFSFDAFKYEFDDLQATAVQPNLTNIRFNVAEAELSGVELSVDARLVDFDRHQLDVNVNASLLDSEIVSISSDVSAIDLLRPGNRLPGSPEQTINYFIRYIYSIGNERDFNFTINGRHTSDDYKRLTNNPNSIVESYSLLNAQAMLNWNDRWSTYVYGRNLMDETYFIDAANYRRIVGAPRIFGLGIRARF